MISTRVVEAVAMGSREPRSKGGPSGTGSSGTSLLGRSPLRAVSSCTQVFHVGAPFPLECGGSLDKVQVAYRTWGSPSRPAILVCHALTGSADADEWWAELFGSGKVLDSERNFIVCSNVLGGCYGTTGPDSPKPDGTGHWSVDFPPVTVRDVVRLQALLLDYLDVGSLHLVLGGSFGGMQALEWAAIYPDRVRAVAPIAAPAAQGAWAIALAEAGRQAIEADSNWQGGRYEGGDGPRGGLAAARSLGLISYRSPQSFTHRFGRQEQYEGFSVENYLRYQGDKFVRRFDANTYLLLGEAMNSHDLGRGRGGTECFLRSMDTPALVVAIDSDLLYPKEEQDLLVRYMPRAELATLRSPHGHDAFLMEGQALGEVLLSFLNEI